MAPKKDADVYDGTTKYTDDTVDQDTDSNVIPPWKIVWLNVIFHSTIYLFALYGIYRIFFCQYQTILFMMFLYFINALGITAGAHRLWAHRSYKATTPLKILLMVFNCVAMQNDIIEWARDHRVHHKFSETNADPHNARRGFFFAHVGWLLVRKHPDVIRKGKTLDMSDLYNDKILRFQQRFYKPLVLFFCFVLPTTIPVLWGESVINAFFTCCMLRSCATLNATWLVNSAAHLWGARPYDKSINPAQNILVSTGAIGEGFHNYHHTFPQDYKTSEFSWYFNQTTFFIDFMAWLGWAYDRKTMSKQTILERKEKTGDGSS